VIFQAPKLHDEDIRVLELIREQRILLRHQVNQAPNRWTGLLRRNAFARAVQGSNTIEGYNATVDETAQIINLEKPESVEEETYRAILGYQQALTYILQTSDDPYFDLNAQFIRSLHFMMMNYDLGKLPGQWRPGGIYIVHEPTGETVYEGPDAERIPGLIEEMIAQIQDTDEPSRTVRAAMAHLNLTLIHPFKDGNGRMARAVQTLVLAREGIISPVFCSIEEWLGKNTTAYYDVLAHVGQGAWHPENSALPWIRFCFRAHYQQASTIIRRNREYGRAWEELERHIEKNELNQRMIPALMDATFGFRVRNQRYREECEISGTVASRDLKTLCDHKLLDAVGDKRGRYYTAGQPLIELRHKIHDKSKAEDPYQIIAERAQPSLF